MSEKKIIQYIILLYWTFFYGTSVIDKIIPDVYPLWVGVDFYTLFVKLFASLGLKEPIYATITLAMITLLEIATFVCFLFALFTLYRDSLIHSRKWCDRAVLLSVLTWSLFAIGDQFFGDRFNLMEHSIFWILTISSWAIFRYCIQSPESFLQFNWSKNMTNTLFLGLIMIVIISFVFFQFSQDTFAQKKNPINGEEIAKGIFKFDFPFLGDKFTMENTLKSFEAQHPELKITYIYTGPDELNTKKKTHMLLYVFTENK